MLTIIVHFVCPTCEYEFDVECYYDESVDVDCEMCGTQLDPDSDGEIVG